MKTYAVTETVIKTTTCIVVACDVHDATNVIRRARNQIWGQFTKEQAQARIKSTSEKITVAWDGLPIPGLPDEDGE